MYVCAAEWIRRFRSSRDILEMPSKRRASGRVRVSLNLKDESFARIQNANAINSVNILRQADSCMCKSIAVDGRCIDTDFMPNGWKRVRRLCMSFRQMFRLQRQSWFLFAFYRLAGGDIQFNLTWNSINLNWIKYVFSSTKTIDTNLHTTSLRSTGPPKYWFPISRKKKNNLALQDGPKKTTKLNMKQNLFEIHQIILSRFQTRRQPSPSSNGWEGYDRLFYQTDAFCR